MTNENETGVVSRQKNYTVEAKYSKEATEKKLIRFTMKGTRKSFEISIDELIDIAAQQVNQDLLAPMFVDTQKVNVVQISRQIKAVANEDIKKGTEFRMNYIHPYPIEFAIIEEAMNFAKIEGDTTTVLTKEFIEEVKAKIQPRMNEFVQKFYQSFKQFDKKEEVPPKK